MYFCENCANMLYIKIDDKEHLQYNCKYCNCVYEVEDLSKGKSKKKDDNCIYKHNHNTDSYSFKTHINDTMFSDPTIPRLNNLKCINDKCPTNTQGVPKEVLYIKYNSEDMLYLYCCAKCKTHWTSSFTRVQ